MKNFPMFLKMSGRRVLIIGGGEQAVQKTRLILKTEAEICLLAAELDPELLDLVAEGRVRHLSGPLTVELLQSAILVFSATGCAGAGAVHAALAKQANCIINVVDMPDHCEAMTPSIVDRDPLVVAIGTEGNAPILGRQIKSMIETKLEPGLGRLVTFAGRMRPRVAQRIRLERRRAFWRWVFSEQPRREFGRGNERAAFDLIKSGMEKSEEAPEASGSIYLIAAKSQEPDLMTIRNVRHLQEAEVIFHERGQHARILELARRDAKRVAFDSQKKNTTSLARIIAAASTGGKDVVVLSSTGFDFGTADISDLIGATTANRVDLVLASRCPREAIC